MSDNLTAGVPDACSCIRPLSADNYFVEKGRCLADFSRSRPRDDSWTASRACPFCKGSGVRKTTQEE